MALAGHKDILQGAYAFVKQAAPLQHITTTSILHSLAMLRFPSCLTAC